MTNKKVIIDGVEYVPKVEEYVPKVEEVEAKEWPQEGEEYFYVDSANVIDRTTWEADPYDKNDYDVKRKDTGNMFPTEQKAEYERLRRECMATRWVPEKSDFFWVVMIDHADLTIKIEKSYNVLGGAEIAMGLAAPTKEEAKARWDMYGEAWLDVLKT